MRTVVEVGAARSAHRVAAHGIARGWVAAWPGIVASRRLIGEHGDAIDGGARYRIPLDRVAALTADRDGHAGIVWPAAATHYIADVVVLHHRPGLIERQDNARADAAEGVADDRYGVLCLLDEDAGVAIQ